MSKRVQLIRHATAAADAFTGLAGELSVDTTVKALRVHDGLTAGGTPQARADLANVSAVTTSVDGKMSAADKVKLDGIEANATGDQTGAEIKAAYEAEADTNAYTDAEQTKVGHLTVTQAVDLDQMETDVTANNAKVTNATHTGQVTGGGALVLDVTAISSQTDIGGAVDRADEMVINDGGVLRKTAVSRLDLGFAGQVVKMAADATPPGNVLYADGSAVSRTTYAALFAVLGTVWGVGDGSTTFNLPDYRGKFLRGWDDGAGVDTDRVAFGDAQADAFESHSHSLKGQQPVEGGSSQTNIMATSGTGFASGLTGGTETRPVNENVTYWIRY